MLTILQPHARTISILLLIALIIALLFSPNSAQILSTAIIIFGVGTAVVFTVKSNQEKQESDKLTRNEFLKNTFLDLLGLAIVMGLAIFFGRMAGSYAGQSWGVFAGILAGIAVGFGVGFCIGFGIGLWRRSTDEDSVSGLGSGLESG